MASKRAAAKTSARVSIDVHADLEPEPVVYRATWVEKRLRMMLVNGEIVDVLTTHDDSELRAVIVSKLGSAIAGVTELPLLDSEVEL